VVGIEDIPGRTYRSSGSVHPVCEGRGGQPVGSAGGLPQPVERPVPVQPDEPGAVAVRDGCGVSAIPLLPEAVCADE